MKLAAKSDCRFVEISSLNFLKLIINFTLIGARNFIVSTVIVGENKYDSYVVFRE